MSYTLFLTTIATLTVMMAGTPVYLFFQGESVAALVIGLPSVIVMLAAFGLMRGLVEAKPPSAPS
jgi:hypothetical protein